MNLRPDPRQQAAAASDAARIAIIAAAGAGKTATLIQRANRLLRQGAPPAQIAILTAETAAARRIAKQLDQTPGFIGPVRAAAHRIMSVFHPHYSLLTYPQILELIRDHISLAPPEDDIERSEAEAIILWRRNSLALPVPYTEPPPLPSWARIIARYDTDNHGSDCYDSDEITYLASFRLAEADARPVPLDFRHILCDDYHLYTPSECVLADQMAGPETSMAIAYDPNQVTGNDNSRIFLELNTPYDPEVILLETNYRAPRRQAAALRQFTEHPDHPELQTLPALLPDDAPDGRRPHARAVANRAECVHEAIALVAAKLRKGAAPGDCAILYRHAPQLRAALARHLAAAGIPCHMFGNRRHAYDSRLAITLALLNLAANPDDLSALATASARHTTAIHRRTLNADTCRQIRELARTLQTDASAAARHVAHEALPDYHPMGVYIRHALETRDRIAELAQQRKTDWNRLLRFAWECAATVNDPMSDPEFRAQRIVQAQELGSDEPVQELRAVEKLLDFANATQPPFRGRHYQADIASLVNSYRLAEVAQYDPSPAADGVAVGSTFNAVGREWPYVIIADAYDDHIPGPDGDSSFEQRLFYTAASRASRELHIITADGGNDRVSPYIARLDAELLAA